MSAYDLFQDYRLKLYCDAVFENQYGEYCCPLFGIWRWGGICVDLSLIIMAYLHCKQAQSFKKILPIEPIKILWLRGFFLPSLCKVQ